MEQKNTWETYDEKQLGEVDAFAREYMDFLDRGKTERECIDQIVNTLDEAGYQELEALVKDGKKCIGGADCQKTRKERSGKFGAEKHMGNL